MAVINHPVDREVAAGSSRPPDFVIDLPDRNLDVILSQGGEVWDHAAEVLILEEAGGRFRDPMGGRRLDLRGGIYTNGKLDAQVGAVLGRV